MYEHSLRLANLAFLISVNIFARFRGTKTFKEEIQMFILVSGVNPVLRMAVAGGGGNWFGPYHTKSLRMSGDFELSAGALSSNPAKSLKTAGEERFKRGYETWQKMVDAEFNSRSAKFVGAGQAAEAISILTRNGSHFEIADAVLDLEKPVYCEKPLTTDVNDARALLQKVQAKNLPFVTSYTYCGYPMVKLARLLVQNGDIGDVYKVVANYKQGWLAGDTENWRCDDPAQAGASSCGGDIGTHAFQFVRYVAGLGAKEVGARTYTLQGKPGVRKLDDDFRADVVLDTSDGRLAVAEISASQVERGGQNDCSFEIYGTKGAIKWTIKEFAKLEVYNANAQKIAEHWDGIGQGFPGEVQPYMTLPGRHPEGHFPAMNNLYQDFRRLVQGEKPSIHVPGIHDGVAGVEFIDRAVYSQSQGGIMVPVPKIGLVDNSL